jgi:hypothetical protein
MISWETQYELGIKSIDDQHKELVNIINKMAALLIEAKQGVDIYDEVVAVIGDLKNILFTISNMKKIFLTSILMNTRILIRQSTTSL